MGYMGSASQSTSSLDAIAESQLGGDHIEPTVVGMATGGNVPLPQKRRVHHCDHRTEPKPLPHDQVGDEYDRFAVDRRDTDIDRETDSFAGPKLARRSRSSDRPCKVASDQPGFATISAGNEVTQFGVGGRNGRLRRKSTRHTPILAAPNGHDRFVSTAVASRGTSTTPRWIASTAMRAV